VSQRIGEYKNTRRRRQPQNADQKTLQTDGEGKITLCEPLKPPAGRQSNGGRCNVWCTTKKPANSFMAFDVSPLRPQPLTENSYMLASVAYRISAEFIDRGKPRIEVSDSRTYFSR